MNYFSNSGTQLYYETHGEGDPLLIIPGGGADGRYYQPIVDILKSNYRVILPDPRGSGRSEKGSQDYSFDLLAEDMKALLDHLNINQTFILGHSMGGMVAQYFACHYPVYARKLILFATSNELTAFGKHCCKTAMITKTEASLKAFMHVMAIWNFSESFFSDENNMKNLVAGAADDPYPIKNQSLIEQMDIIKDFDSSSYLSNINISSLIIGCEKDIIFPVASVKGLKSLISKATYHEIEGAAHSAHIEQPKVVADVINNFLLSTSN